MVLSGSVVQGGQTNRWAEWLKSPRVRAWVARVGEEVAGMVELQAQSAGDVEIVVLCLAPDLTPEHLT
jgi:hypothetical protein